jgi:type IX secretion system PorP/SprF family membrane protein
MMILKRLTILCVILMGSFTSQAQQVGLNSQYMFNTFLLNPAVAGSKQYIPIHTSVRKQWVGINEGPVSQSVTAHGYNGYNFGLGGGIFNETTGPTRRTGLNFSTAYHLVLKGNASRQQQMTMSFGLAATLTQHVLDKNALTTYLPNDPTILSAYNSTLIPDVNFGFLLHKGNRWEVGMSAMSLVQTRVDIYNLGNQVRNKLVRNYFLHGSYTFDVSKNFKIQPSLVFRMIEALPMQFDINTRFIIQEKYWAGFSYRHNDAISAMVGLNIYRFRFGYSYDFTLSDMRNFSAGSHEIALTYFIHGEGKGFQSNKSQSRSRYRPTPSF